eukprot:scaffold1800_cov237-Pinguiococcus_pyrenoidosus.AAC.8
MHVLRRAQWIEDTEERIHVVVCVEAQIQEAPPALDHCEIGGHGPAFQLLPYAIALPVDAPQMVRKRRGALAVGNSGVEAVEHHARALGRVRSDELDLQAVQPACQLTGASAGLRILREERVLDEQVSAQQAVDALDVRLDGVVPQHLRKVLLHEILEPCVPRRSWQEHRQPQQVVSIRQFCRLRDGVPRNQVPQLVPEILVRGNRKPINVPRRGVQLVHREEPFRQRHSSALVEGRGSAVLEERLIGQIPQAGQISIRHPLTDMLQKHPLLSPQSVHELQRLSKRPLGIGLPSRERLGILDEGVEILHELQIRPKAARAARRKRPARNCIRLRLRLRLRASRLQLLRTPEMGAEERVQRSNLARARLRAAAVERRNLIRNPWVRPWTAQQREYSHQSVHAPYLLHHHTKALCRARGVRASLCQGAEGYASAVNKLALPAPSDSEAPVVHERRIPRELSLLRRQGGTRCHDGQARGVLTPSQRWRRKQELVHFLRRPSASFIRSPPCVQNPVRCHIN